MPRQDNGYTPEYKDNRRFDAEEYVAVYYQKWPLWLYLVIGCTFGFVIWGFAPNIIGIVLDFLFYEIIGILIVVVLIMIGDHVL